MNSLLSHDITPPAAALTSYTLTLVSRMGEWLTSNGAKNRRFNELVGLVWWRTILLNGNMCISKIIYIYKVIYSYTHIIYIFIGIYI